MRILIGLAAGMLATAAIAQTTTTTNSTTTMEPMGNMAMPEKPMATKSTTATHKSMSSHSSMSGNHAMHSKRSCHTHMRHGKKVRVCKTHHMM